MSVYLGYREQVPSRNCNWGTCIVPPTRRPRAHHRVNPYLGARRQFEQSDYHITHG